MRVRNEADRTGRVSGREMVAEVCVLRVECRSSEAGPVPVWFGRGVAKQQVAEVLDRWPGEGYCYFRVRTEEGSVYILRHDERDDSWQISAYRRSDPLP